MRNQLAGGLQALNTTDGSAGRPCGAGAPGGSCGGSRGLGASGLGETWEAGDRARGGAGGCQVSRGERREAWKVGLRPGPRLAPGCTLQVGLQGAPPHREEIGEVVQGGGVGRTPSLPACWPPRTPTGAEFCVFPQELCGERGEPRQDAWCQACLGSQQGVPQHVGPRGAPSLAADAPSVDGWWASSRRGRGPAGQLPAEPTPTCSGLGTTNGMRASMGTTHGEMVVPKLFPRNGPRGTYSHF